MYNNPSVLYHAINPENSTMKEGKVVSSMDDNGVTTVISGRLTIGTLMNTIDDILKTAILTQSVEASTLE